LGLSSLRHPAMNKEANKKENISEYFISDF
jgi:hypothetical protein